MRVLILILAAALAAAVPAAAQSRRGEMRGAWMDRGYGRDWPAIMQSLKENGFNALFPKMCTGGAAWYPSKVLPAAEGATAGRDELAEAAKAAKQYGIELHVWRINWMTEGIPKDVLAKWEAEGRLMRNAGGQLVRDDPADPLKRDWLCPSNPENRKLEKDAMLEVVRKYDVAGIQFDSLGFPSAKYCYCDHCRDQFQKDAALKVEQWPADVLPGGKHAKVYERWRQALQTSLLYEISKEAHRLKPDIKVSLVAWPEADSARQSVLQDWPTWAKSGALDFVVFRTYANNPDQLARWLSAEEDEVFGAAPVYAGLGAFTMKKPATLIQQIKTSREAGADGFVAFAYYNGDLDTWLPTLRATVTGADPDPMPHWSPPSKFGFSGPAARPSLTGRQVAAGGPLTVEIRLGLGPATGVSEDEEEGAAQAESMLRRSSEARRPVRTPDVLPPDASGDQGYRLSGRVVMEDASGTPLGMLGGFDGNRQFRTTTTFTVPRGPFRIAIYGSEKPAGSAQPREFVTRSPLLIGVAEAEGKPQPAAPAPPAAEGTHAQLARLFAEAPSRLEAAKLADIAALVAVKGTGEEGGDWWFRVADGKCTSGEGLMENPDLLITGAAEDLLAAATHQADPADLWTAGRLTVSGDYALAKRLFAAVEGTE